MKTDLIIESFLSLFEEEDKFVGSQEHARVKIQLKINKHLTKDLIRKLFNIFRTNGIIETAKERVNFTPRIGEKTFRKTSYYTYKLKSKNVDKIKEEVEELIKKSKGCFISMPSKEQIKEIRELEKKAIFNREVLNTFDYNSKLYNLKSIVNKSNVDLLYDKSKKEVDEFILDLKEYSVQSQKRQKEINERKQNKVTFFALFNKLINNDDIRRVNIKKTTECFYGDETKVIGIVKPKTIKFNYPIVEINGDEFNFNFALTGYSFDYEESSFCLYNDNIAFHFKYPIRLEDEIIDAFGWVLV